MSAYLDLDDVAATSPLAQTELDGIRVLLTDIRRHLKATVSLYEVLPAERHAKHLATTARQLVARIDALTHNAEQETPDGD